MFLNSVFRLATCVVCTLWLVAGAASAQLADYEIGGGDTLKITVFQSPELSIEARVSEDGSIGFPLLGRVKVGGLTTQKAEKTIADQLKVGNFIKEAQVSVNVIAYRSQQVSILGYVAKPGRYPLDTKGIKLTEMIANAGGVNPGGSDIVVMNRRTESGKTVRQEIDLASIFLDGKTDLDVVLQPGDAIYINRAPLVYVYGQVQRPGNFTMERNMTVGQAIAKAGGFTMRARESGMRLQRRDAAGRVIEILVKMDDPILADDQIFVRESLF